MSHPSLRAGRTALVVDDTLLYRERIARTLRTNGFRVLEAADGFHGLGLLARAAPSLALLVVATEMPGIHGWEVIRFAVSKAPRLRILRLGRPDDQAPAAEYRRFEAVASLRKPFTASELLAKLPGRARR